MSTGTTSQYTSNCDDSDDDGHGQGEGRDHHDLTGGNYLQLDHLSDEDDSISFDRSVRGEEEEAVLGRSQDDGGEAREGDKGEDKINWFTSPSVGDVEVFQGSLDRYKGLTVRSEEEQCSTELFGAKLSKSLTKWLGEGVRAVWFYYVTHENAEWVPILVKQGFTFHHANMH